MTLLAASLPIALAITPNPRACRPTTSVGSPGISIPHDVPHEGLRSSLPSGWACSWINLWCGRSRSVIMWSEFMHWRYRSFVYFVFLYAVVLNVGARRARIFASSRVRRTLPFVAVMRSRLA